MITKPIYNTVWRILNANANFRVSTLGEAVKANDDIILEHCATGQFLSSDKINYINEFGPEYEVSVCS